MCFCEIGSKCCTVANKGNKYGQICPREGENIGSGKPDKPSNRNYGNISVPKQTARQAQGTPTELSNWVPKKARLLTCEHSDNSKGKPSGLSWPFPAGTSITPLEENNMRPGSGRATNKSGILANAGEKTQPLFPRETTTLTVL